MKLRLDFDLVAEGLFDGPSVRLPSGEPEALWVVFVRDARQRPLDR